MINSAKISGQNFNPVIIGNNNDCDDAVYSISNYDSSYTYSWYITPQAGIIVPITGSNSSKLIKFSHNISECNYATLIVTATYQGNSLSSYLKIYPCCNTVADYNYDNFTTNSDLSINLTSPNNTIKINGDFILNHNVSINNAKIHISPNSKIVLNAQDISLSLTNTEIISNINDCCEEMWDGIYTKSPTQQVIIQNTKISNAQNALNIFFGTPFLVENSIFVDNYKNIYIYQGSGIVTSPYPGIIRNTSFIGNNSLPQPPYQGEQTYSGIEVFRTYDFTIGDPSSIYNQNTFENMFCGIKTTQSYVEIFNNYFKNINSTIQPTGGNPVQIYNATAIFSIGNDTSIQLNNQWHGVKIGGSGLESNIFDSCYNGIYAFNLKLLAEGNSINISNFGVEGRDLFDDSYVRFNKIRDASGIDTTHCREGIRILNIQPRDCNYNIISNNINATYRGIFINNANSNSSMNLKVRINSNTIKLSGLSQPQFKPFSGILAGGCYGITIKDNNLSIANFGIPTSANLYYGVDIAQVRNADILCNTNEYFGAGININGDCKLSRFYGNILKDCYYGFYFNTQSTISQQGYYNGALSVNSENEWVGDYLVSGNIYRKLWANPANLLSNGVHWYVRNSPLTYRLQNTQNNTAQYIYEDSSNPVNIFYCQNPQTTLPLPIVNAQHRDELLVDIVRDSNSYEQLEEQYKVYDKEAVYKALKEDNTLMTMGATTDAEYLQFFSLMATTNVEKISEIENLIKNREDSLAKIKNQNLQDQKMIDYFRKVVNEIYLNTFARGNYDLTQDQKEILMPIAVNYTPWEGGDAVYIARNMLNIDIDAIKADFTKAPPKQYTDNAQLSVKLYPNPTKDEVMIEFGNVINVNGIIEIFDFTGSVVQSQNIASGFQYIYVSVKNLKSGIYFFRIMLNNELIAKDKLLIVK